MGILFLLFMVYLYTIREKPLQRRLLIAAVVPAGFAALLFGAFGGAMGLGLFFTGILGLIPFITVLWTFILVVDIIKAKSPLTKDYYFAAIILAILTIIFWIAPSLLPSSKVDLSI